MKIKLLLPLLLLAGISLAFNVSADSHEGDGAAPPPLAELWVWIYSVGGPANLSLAVPYENYADMAPPEVSFYEFMVKHTSEETAASTMQEFSNSFWSSEYTVYQLRRDLSTPRGE